MKSKPLRRTKGALPLAAIAGLAFTTSSTIAEVINIDNAGFELSDTGIGNGNNTDIDDWTEDAGDAFVDLNGTTWVPEASDTLYIGGGASVNQDLSHNWSATDSFTLGLIAMNPRWFGGTAELRVQLRQASDDTVLWDSGLVDVSGTVTTTAPATYTGTGHDLSWTIDASTFVTGSAGEQINIRIENVTGVVYADNVSLDVTGPDVIAPTLASTDPADEATGVSPSSDLVATFSEDIALTGIGSVTIRDLGPGPDVVIGLPNAQVSVSGTTATDLIINPTADLNLGTDYAIQISADAIEDLATSPNAFAGILDDTTWNFQTIAETTPPTLVSTSPVDDASDVAVNSNLVATFDETVTAGTGNITIKNLTEATDTVLPVGDAQVDVSGTDLTIDLSTDLDPGDDYAIQIDAGAITDTVGNPYAGILAPDVTTWNFTTAADTIDPTIIALSPADDATGVLESANLVATFSETIMAAAPTLVLDENFDAAAALPAGWASNGPSNGTDWEVGPPSGVTSGPPAASSAPNCAGTNIGGYYTENADVSLKSPGIPIPAGSGATLSFKQWIDTDLSGSPHDLGSVRILDADNSDTPIAGLEILNIEGDGTAGWTSETLDLPAVDVGGKNIKVEFRFVSNAGTVPDTDVWSGFYIDDVQVAVAGSITLKNLSEATETVIPVTDPQVSISGDTLTIDPATDLDFEDDYAVQIGANAITDVSGNSFAGIGDDATWNFTTRVMPTVITINNFGFESSSTGIGNGNNTDIDDWTEDTGDAFVDMNGTAWVPEASDTLYIGGGASVNQDLSHNWSSGNVFTLGLIAMNPTWSDNNNTFKVQLRQASDDTVLWDSGDQNVGGTVTAGPAYTGTGHVFSWSIDASTFTAGTEGEQINIRIAHVSGGPVYADKVSLDVTGGGGGGNDFGTWIAGYSVGGQTGIGDDPDGDGVDSGVENFFGTAPDEFSQGLVSGTAGGGTFTFTHPQGTLAADLTAAYRWSRDLQAFNADGASDGTNTVTFSTQIDTPSAGTTTVTATVTAGPVPTKLFVDVEVSQP